MPIPKLDDYAPTIGPELVSEIRMLGQRFKEKSIKNVNSTFVGGGVAEILNRLVPLLNEMGINAGWEVIKGGEDFFKVTKAFHNALHGARVRITKKMFDIHAAYNEENARHMDLSSDVMVIHDPQPVGLIKARSKNSKRWLWRCHIDVTYAHRGVWNYLEPYINMYDASIFTSPSFAKQLPIPQFMITPSIDPLSDKNMELPPEYIDMVLEKYGIPRDKPLVAQISRYDRLKDPVGAIKAFKMARRYVDCRLLLVGSGASDDPEGAEVLNEVKEAAAGDQDIIILYIPPSETLSMEVNALQRAATIILQKSIREGFALTVTEALWKARPVIASNVGGIPLQVLHNLTGVLVHSIEGCANQIRYLISNPEFAAKLGQNGREHIRRNFLLTRHLKDYLLLLVAIEHRGENIVSL